jgi:hypothetical protein
MAKGGGGFLYTMCMQVFQGHPSRHRGEVAVWLQTSQNLALVGVGDHYLAPGRFIPGKDHVPIVLGAEWASVWHGRPEKKSRLPLGFDPRTVQPIISRYAD